VWIYRGTLYLVVKCAKCAAILFLYDFFGDLVYGCWSGELHCFENTEVTRGMLPG
jgi:hypothetical protein